MKYSFIILSVFLFACTGKQDKAIQDIKHLEANKSLRNSDTLINSYINFVKNYPEHKLSADFLFKAAQASVKSNRIINGAKLYERIALEYPADTLAPEALLRAGLNFDASSDPANAKRLYELFLKNYPKHPRYNDVKLYHENVGLSADELIRRFNERLLANGDSTLAK